MSVEGTPTTSRPGLKIPSSVFQDLFPTLVIEMVILKMAPLQNGSSHNPWDLTLGSFPLTSVFAQVTNILFIVKPWGFWGCLLQQLSLFILIETFISEVKYCQTRHWLNYGQVSSERRLSNDTVAKYSINRRSEWVPTQPATLGMMVEMNQSVSMGWLD